MIKITTMSVPEKTLAALEAILFIHGEPVETEKIASLLKLDQRETAEVSHFYQEKLASDPTRGLFLAVSGDRIALRTKPEFGQIVESLIKENLKEELTPAALDTLAIVGYLGPIARPMIDYIRGVNSSFTLRGLVLRRLLERAPNPSKTGAYTYRVTPEFLAHLGLKEATELPDYADYRNFLERIEPGQREEVKA